MGRRRKQRPRSQPASAPRDAVFMKHVPRGRKPCSWCCEGRLAVSPGFFRDVDIEDGLGKFGVCGNCAGTGIELGLSKTDRDEIFRLRFRRSDILGEQLPRLKRQLTFAEVMVIGREEVLELINRALAALDAAERDEVADRALVMCARMLGTLFHREEFENQYERALRRALEACRCLADRSGACPCRQYRGRLIAAREAVCALVPAAGMPEHRRLFEAIRPHATRIEAEHNHLVDWVKNPLPFEELQLLLLVRWYWAQAGKPTGCYAERLVRFLEDEILNPQPPAPRRAITPEVATQFQPDEVPPELEGLDGALLADLHDCVSKFGREDYADRVRRGSLREPAEVHVCVSTEVGNLTILIIGEGGQTTSAGAHIFRVPGRGTNPAPVIWDTRVRVDDIRAFIARIDEIMGSQGLVHPETGTRTAVVSDHPSPKDSVDEVFATPGTCMLVLPGEDAEAKRQRFDCPEDVVIMPGPLGGTYLHHRRDVAMVQRQGEIAKRVLARHGLTTVEQIGDLPWTRIEELRAEVDRELASEAS